MSSTDKKRTLLVAGSVVVLVAVVALFALKKHGGSSRGDLAEVGPRAITDEEFAAYLRFKHQVPRNRDQARAALDEYLSREALAEAIRETGSLDNTAVQAELREFEKEMLISRYFEQYLRTAVTDQAIQSYYNAHASEYEERKVHVAHILVRTNRRMSDEERRAASARMQDAVAQLRSGRDFAEVARLLSEDRTSSERGGDLGFIREGAIDARFSEVAFRTATGQVSEPFETPFGLHVIKVLEAPQTVRRPLAAVEGDIRYRLRNQAKQAEIERLRRSVPVERRPGGYVPSAPSAESSSMRGAHASAE